METLSFPRYNVAEIVVHIRNKILTGADGKNLSKNDRSPPDAFTELMNTYMLPLNVCFSTNVPCISCLCTIVHYRHKFEGDD